MARREPTLADYDTHNVDGYDVLVGRTARDNDKLTFKVARPNDVWLHVGGGTPGSHVVIRTPEGGEVPRAVVKRAAELAVAHSKAKGATGKVDVHVCRACDVSKPRGAKPGSVQLRRYESVKVYARA
ncbi:NFACT RNA binding domain-containing protein [Rubrivirga sp. IMCC45206]|uniref:NFACT RNA binding domain-containing protein n=1 Tax=Rubrivirga sp. IMCC45206 TaxID=3391614 RepID=UPI003990290A